MKDEFTPAWWLRNRHLQTIWGRLARPRRIVDTRREVVTTPDGDELVLDQLEGDPRQRHIVVLHGLEGSSNSVYIQGLLSLAERRHVPMTVMNFRSCARDLRRIGTALPNRGTRLYHSGETTDLDFAVRLLRDRGSEKLGAIGISIGGNVLLKWLGEQGAAAPLARAATLSVPYDLAASARHLERGSGALYARSFLRSLNSKAVAITTRHPHLAPAVDLERARRARTFHEYDDAVTAPLHGFDDVHHYYRESSSLRYLSRITVPTLCISALDDPFLPPETLDEVRREKSDVVELLVTARGGHVGFVGGVFPWKPVYWAEGRAIDFVCS